MGDFIQGWRCKAGLVTLAMALLLIVPWMRSYLAADVVWLDLGKERHQITSGDGHIGWQAHKLFDDNQLAFRIRKFPRQSLMFDRFVSSLHPEISWQAWAAPYWSLVLPLTLLSAWLILSKPRRAKAEPLL